ncbi:MAG: hypothetical protein IH624_03765 [Phycisphaerae bacterium]|nr:hypothetical protein [Phycisphaerae bacterium]
MTAKKTRGAVICTVMLVVLVAVPAVLAEVPYRPTPGGANRWVYVHENLYSERPEPAGEGLFAATWGVVSGTADAIGKTFGAVYASIFPVQTERRSETRRDRTGQLQYRFAPRFHGQVARWIVVKECP